MTPDEAVKEWARRRLVAWGIKVERIESVDFGIGDNGACSTCSWPYAGVEVGYKQKNGHVKYDIIQPTNGLVELYTEIYQIMEEGDPSVPSPQN